MSQHQNLPKVKELDAAMSVLSGLSVLTAVVAISMVVFGKVAEVPQGMTGDLYRLVRPMGGVILGLCGGLVWYFRKSERGKNAVEKIAQEEKYYHRQPAVVMWGHLMVAGIAILLVAESMIRAVQVVAEISGIPLVVVGVLTGIIGCMEKLW